MIRLWYKHVAIVFIRCTLIFTRLLLGVATLVRDLVAAAAAARCWWMLLRTARRTEITPDLLSARTVRFWLDRGDDRYRRRCHRRRRRRQDNRHAPRDRSLQFSSPPCPLCPPQKQQQQRGDCRVKVVHDCVFLIPHSRAKSKKKHKCYHKF